MYLKEIPLTFSKKKIQDGFFWYWIINNESLYNMTCSHLAWKILHLRLTIEEQVEMFSFDNYVAFNNISFRFSFPKKFDCIRADISIDVEQRGRGGVAGWGHDTGHLSQTKPMH